MASLIDATVGGADSNCYITTANANAYFADTLREAGWDECSSDDRERALIQATQQIERLRLHGTAADTITPQALHFPRSTDYDTDGETYIIPDDIEDAICEQAMYLLQQQANPELLDRRTLQAQGVRSISLDGVSESYGGRLADGFSASARHLLEPFTRRTAKLKTRTSE